MRIRSHGKLRVAGIVLGALVLLLLVALIVVQTGPVRRYALRQAERALAAQDIHFEARRLDYTLARGRIELEGVVIRAAGAPDLPPFAVVAHLQARISVPQLILGRYRLREVRLEQPAVHVFIAADGRDNLPRLPPHEDEPEEEPGAIDYLIHDLLATAGSLVYEDRQRDVALRLPQWQLEIEGDELASSHELRFVLVRPGSAGYQGRELELEALRAEAVLHPGALELRQAVLQAAGSEVSLSGMVEDLDAPILDLRAQADLQLAPLAAFAGVEEQVSGRLQAEATAAGPLPELRVSAQATGTALRYEQFDRAELELQAEFDRAVERLRLPRLVLRSPAGAMQAEADVLLATGAGQSTLTARLERLDLERVMSALDLPVRLASRATGAISARWPDVAVRRALGEADLRLEPTRPLPAEDVLPVAGRVRASASEQRVVLHLDGVQALAAETQGQVVVGARRRLAGQVQARVADVGALLTQLQAFTGSAEPLLPLQIAGAARAVVNLGGTVEQPRAAASVAARALAVGQLRDVSLNADAVYTPQALLLQRAQVAWREQTLSAQGRILFTEPSPTLDLSAQVEELSIAAALAAAGRDDIPARGVVSARATIAGTVARPQAGVELSATALHVYGEPFGDLAASARLAGQVVDLVQLRLQKPDDAGQLSAQGRFHLQTRAYELRASADDLRIHQLELPDQPLLRARINLQAEGRGTLDDPALRADLNVEELALGELEVGAAQAGLNLADRVAALEARVPAWELRTTARVGTEAPHPTQLRITAAGTDLARLPLLEQQELEGRLSAQVEAAGELDRWQQGSATAQVSDLRMTVNGQAIRNDGPLVIRYADRLLTVQQARILAPGSVLEARGSLPLEPQAGTSDLRLQGRFDLAALSGFFPDLEARGLAQLDAAVAGTLRALLPTATLRLADGYIFTPTLEPAITDLNLAAEVAEGRLEVQRLAARWAGAEISLSAHAPLTILSERLPFAAPAQLGPARAQFTVAGLDLGEIAAIPGEVDGEVSLRGRLEAPRLDLAAARGSLVFDRLRLELGGGVPVEQEAPATLILVEGAVRVEPLRLRGPETNLELAGTLGLRQPRPLDLRITGAFDAALFAGFLEGASASGPGRIELAAAGTLDDPDLRGFFTLQDAQFSYDRPLLALEDLDLRVDLAGDRLSLTRLAALLNGGPLTGGGTLRLARGTLQEPDLRFAAENVFMDLPEGLRTLSDFEITLRPEGDFLVFGGKVQVREGAYTEPIRLEREFFRYLRQGETIDLTEERAALLQRLRFNIALTTISPLIVDNNLAEAAVEADLVLLGDFYRPGLTGRVTLEEGGELYLADQTYVVERGIITFIDERRIEPSLDILAQTRRGGYDITLNISGEVGDIETTLTSDPELPEPDIVALLVLGLTLEEVRGAELEVAQEQMLSLLAGQVTGQLSRQLEGVTGLSMVRIDPAFVSAEENPGARLTVGEDITRQLSFIYSINLTDPRDQLYIAEYDVTRRFTTSGVRQPDNTYRFEFRHDLRFGGQSRPPLVRERRQVGQVNFQGDLFFDPERLARRFRLRSGQQYDFFRARQGLDRLDRLYAEQDRLEASLRVDRRPRNGIMDLTLRIQAGPRVEFAYQGWEPPSRLRDEVRAIWRRGVFDVQRASEANRAVRNALVRRGYLQSEVEHAISTPAEDTKLVTFHIRLGPRYDDIEVLFPGAEGLSPSRLRELLRAQDLEEELHTEPDQVTTFLQRYYREFGYLDAEVAERRYEFDPEAGVARLVIEVEEGPRYRVGMVEFLRATAFSEQQLRAAAQLPPGTPYRPELREEAFERVQDLYWNRGYTGVDITSLLAPDPELGVVNIVFSIDEGRQRVVREVDIRGLDYTTEGMVRSQMNIAPGDVLGHQLLADARRRLYRTGAYTLADIQVIELENDGALPGHQRPVRLQVNLREVQPYRLRYGAFYDTDRGPGGIADFSSRNVIGNARLLGLRTRYDAQLKEARIYFSQPQLRRLPFRSDAVLFAQRDARDAFTTDRFGFTLNQETRFREHYIFNFGYRIEQTRTFDAPDPLLAGSIRVAPLTVAFSRETRNDVLDATRGSFQSHAFEYAPSWLGSQLRFYKYFGQFFRYVGLTEPAEVPFVRGAERSRVVFAGALRVGLAGGLEGQQLVPADRFFAGGGTTIRGFELDSVGPADPLGNPVGGDAVFLFNSELRFPVYWIFDGAAFVDMGNVYRRASDFNPFDVRKGGGLGLRVRTPYFLLRADYGWKLDRRPGETPGRFFFSIGQAF